MEKLILIIGINGVGKEHIRACENLGIYYELFDLDIRNFIGKNYIWNEWGKHKNIVSLSYCISIIDDFKKINPFKYTHIVIAVPDDKHSYYVDLLKDENKELKILVEKPPKCDLNKVQIVGYSDFNFNIQEELCDLVFNVEKVKKYNSNWVNNIEDDLLGHLYYSYCLYCEKKDIKFQKIKEVIFSDKNKLKIILENNVFLTVKRQMEDTYLIINGNKKHNDYEKIFTKQMSEFVFNDFTNINLCKKIENEIERIKEFL